MAFPEGGAPNLKGRSHRTTVNIVIPEEGCEGILVTQGGWFGGYALYVRDDRLFYVQNFVGLERFTVQSEPLQVRGPCKLGVEFLVDENKPGTGGTATLFVDGKAVGSGRIGRTVPFLYSTSEAMNIGLDAGTTVDDTYTTPFKFTGNLQEIVVDLLRQLTSEEQKKERVAVAKAIQDNE